MALLNIIKYPFQKFERPLIFSFISYPIFFLGELSGIGLLILIGGLLAMLSSAILIISMFVLLFKKEFVKSFYTLLFILIIISIFGTLAQ